MSVLTNEALVIQTNNDASQRLEKTQLSAPQPKANQALVKVEYVAQNPTDVLCFDNNIFSDGAVLGCDFAGSVELPGRDVKTLSKGAKVAGLIWGGEMEGLGGYSQYTIADERISFQVPDGISLEAAATIPLASCTSWLALFSKDCLNVDRTSASGTSVLIWGGSSSVGLYAIQIAALYGMDIVTTCSPKHFDLVKRLGAKHVFNYRDEDIVAKIKNAAPNLKYVFDTIGNETSSTTASQAVVESGGALCTVRPGKSFTENVTKQTKTTDVLVWTAFLKDHKLGDSVWPASKEDHELCAEFFQKLPKLLVEGKIQPNLVKLFEDGLDAVPRGFQEYRDGQISGYKVVYKL